MSSSSRNNGGETACAAAGLSRWYRWLVDRLAKFPGRVTAVTFAAGLTATVLVSAVDGDHSAVTVVSLVATLWALFFAVMIYLLTARDTDIVLEQIADLQEQLAAALDAPGEADADTSDADSPALDALADAQAEGAPPGTARDLLREVGARPAADPPAGDSLAATSSAPATVRSGGRAGLDQPVRGGGFRGRHGPLLLAGEEAITGVPRPLMDAWADATGESRDGLSRAWTWDPRTARQWVFETADERRWVVFSRDGRGVGVLPIGAGRGPAGGDPIGLMRAVRAARAAGVRTPRTNRRRSAPPAPDA